MKTFRIYYTFEGHGEIDIKAKNKEEAEDIFNERDWENEGGEWSENTYLITLAELNK